MMNIFAKAIHFAHGSGVQAKNQSAAPCGESRRTVQ
jgi:hypothetical protein